MHYNRFIRDLPKMVMSNLILIYMNILPVHSLFEFKGQLLTLNHKRPSNS